MKARPVALGGVLAALAVAVLMLGGIIPVGTYAAPMLAALPLIVLMQELPGGMCLGWYAAVSLLAVLLCPDKETALVFVFLGWYPLLRPRLEKLPAALRVVLKLLIFNLAVTALYALLIFVFQLEAVVREARETGLFLLAVMLLLGNLCFLLFDVVLKRLSLFYELKHKR